MWQIFFHEDHRGKSPALEFLNNLSARDRAKANNALRLLEEFGTNLSMPHARWIQGRLFYFLQMECEFVILHGYRKQSMKAPEKEIRIKPKPLSP